MIDLHMHSTFSDGSMSPEELVAKAAELGLSAIALTDHDTVGGLQRFHAAGRAHGVRTISGVEITSDLRRGSLHFLGYFVDPSDRQLRQHLDWIRAGHQARNDETLRKLNRMGIRLRWPEIVALAGGEQAGRRHIAQAMVARGLVGNVKEAFDVYLGRARPAYVPRRQLPAQSCIDLIHEAGGVAVLAHPLAADFERRELFMVLEKLRHIGLDGVEVYYPDHTAASVRELQKMAAKLDLVATGGSDFHGSLDPEVSMGRGLGSLRVPDSVLAEIEFRRPLGHYARLAQR